MQEFENFICIFHLTAGKLHETSPGYFHLRKCRIHNNMTGISVSLLISSLEETDQTCTVFWLWYLLIFIYLYPTFLPMLYPKWLTIVVASILSSQQQQPCELASVEEV